MAITVANRNSVLNALLRASAYTGAAALYLSIHTADPGDTGASEYTTYTGTRPAISFGAAASGAATSTNEQDFAAMGATTNVAGVLGPGCPGFNAWPTWRPIRVGPCRFGDNSACSRSVRRCGPGICKPHMGPADHF